MLLFFTYTVDFINLEKQGRVLFILSSNVVLFDEMTFKSISFDVFD